MKEIRQASWTDEAARPEGGEPDLYIGGSIEDRLAAALDENRKLGNALRAAEARERALNHELQHRVRNMVAVIRTIYRRSWEDGASQELFAQHFEGRLSALARYQTYVDDVGLGIELEDVVRNELLDVHSLDGRNCLIEGPAVFLQQKPAEMIGLAVHELTTNAIKFGALAQSGRLRVTWSIREDERARHLEFRWAETGVSVASAAPRAIGFGRQLIEEALPYQLGAVTSFDLKPGGLICSISLPLPIESGRIGRPINPLKDESSGLPTETE